MFALRSMEVRILGMSSVCEQGSHIAGGCCPDGYLCETADNCVPPSGSAYTYDCPASQYLCPSSLSYGCCPNGMACGVNQCYSSDPVTVTSTMVITTTIGGGADDL